MSYQTLKRPVRANLEIKKSQFIAFAYPVASRDEAMFHVEQLRLEFPDARHHCWAYIIGDPSNTTSAGFDDDGEPNGTAGRPILNVLQHKAIGNVIIIVVRYFGGIKLGAGGLTRAYAASAQLAVDEMQLVEFIPKSTLIIETDFANEAHCRYIAAQLDGIIGEVNYSQTVQLPVTIANEHIAEIQENLGIYGKVIDNNSKQSIENDN